MSQFAIDLGVVLLFTLIGGFFAAAEMALVSLRASQLDKIVSEHGKRGRRLADLVQDPNRFLAAVQVGVTLAGFLSAGFGASRMAPQVSPWLVSAGLPQSIADPLAFILVTIVLVYLSLVLGELAPKRLALQRAESISLRVAGFVDWMARFTRPFIWLLSTSTNLVVRLFGGDPAAAKEEVDEEELRGLLTSQTRLSETERELIEEVFAAGERELREVMVPRTEAEFLDANLLVHEAAMRMADLPHSRYPIFRDSHDDVVGFVHVRDVFSPAKDDRDLRLRDIMREIVMMPQSKRIIPAMSEMRARGAHLAIVIDEYGGTAGIVTLEDLVEELIGDIRDEYDEPEQSDDEGQLAMGDVVVDGLLNLDDFEDLTGMTLPEGPYETVAGFVIAVLGALPVVGSTVPVDGHVLTVQELDGRRAARILVSALPEDQTHSPNEPGAVADSTHDS